MIIIQLSFSSILEQHIIDVSEFPEEPEFYLSLILFHMWKASFRILISRKQP